MKIDAEKASYREFQNLISSYFLHIGLEIDVHKLLWLGHDLYGHAFEFCFPAARCRWSGNQVTRTLLSEKHEIAE